MGDDAGFLRRETRGNGSHIGEFESALSRPSVAWGSSRGERSNAKWAMSSVIPSNGAPVCWSLWGIGVGSQPHDAGLVASRDEHLELPKGEKAAVGALEALGDPGGVATEVADAVELIVGENEGFGESFIHAGVIHAESDPYSWYVPRFLPVVGLQDAVLAHIGVQGAVRVAVRVGACEPARALP